MESVGQDVPLTIRTAHDLIRMLRLMGASRLLTIRAVRHASALPIGQALALVDAYDRSRESEKEQARVAALERALGVERG